MDGRLDVPEKNPPLLALLVPLVLLALPDELLPDELPPDVVVVVELAVAKWVRWIMPQVVMKTLAAAPTSATRMALRVPACRCCAAAGMPRPPLSLLAARTRGPAEANRISPTGCATQLRMYPRACSDSESAPFSPSPPHTLPPSRRDRQVPHAPARQLNAGA